MSKHPLLMAMVLALASPMAGALDLTRPEVQAYVAELVRDHGFEADALRAALGKAETRQSILDAISRPAERVKPWHEYRAIFLTPERIRAGAEFWKTHEPQLRRIEARTGVPPEILTGIIGVETFFGQRAGNYRLIDSLATLAFDYPPRSRFFRAELTQLFLLAREEQLDLDTAVGSYAGAMGAPQFIPSSYRNFAVDGDGDGRRDLFGNWDDVLASVANYFVAHKWAPGENVVAAATLTRPTGRRPGDNPLSASSTIASLTGEGVRFATDLPATAPAELLLYEGRDGTEYQVGFHNFFVITRYNRSTMYALAVWQLGQAISAAAGPKATPATAP